MTVTSNPRKTAVSPANYLGAMTYASLVAGYPAASFLNYVAFVTDLGTNGTEVRSNGTRWRPVNGESVLASLGASVSGIGTTETIVCQALLPTGSWQTNDIVRIFLLENKSGAVDNGTLTVRVGTAGTTSDTAITGLSLFPFLGAAGLAQGGIWDIKLISATSAQKIGNNTNTADSYSNAGTVAEAAATVITSAAANPLYVSVGIKSNGATNTVGSTGCQIKLVTP